MDVYLCKIYAFLKIFDQPGNHNHPDRQTFDQLFQQRAELDDWWNGLNNQPDLGRGRWTADIGSASDRVNLQTGNLQANIASTQIKHPIGNNASCG